MRRAAALAITETASLPACTKLVGAAGAAREPPGAAPCEPESDVFALAKSHFDLKEYTRAAHTLQARAQA